MQTTEFIEYENSNVHKYFYKVIWTGDFNS